jgi:hypothetical protein
MGGPSVSKVWHALGPYLRVVAAALVSIPLVWGPRLAFAGFDTFSVVRKPNGATVVSPSMLSLLRQAVTGSMSINPLGGGGAGVAVSKTVPLPVANTMIGGTASGIISRAALMHGAANLLRFGVPGVAAYAALEFVRCREDGTSLAGIECDNGVPEEQVPGYCLNTGAGTFCGTLAFIGSELVRTWPSNTCPYVHSTSPTPPTIVIRYRPFNNCGGTTWSQSTYSPVAANQLQCPETSPGVRPAKMPNGKCPSPDGLPWADTSVADTAARLLDWRNQPGWPTAASDQGLANDIGGYNGAGDPFEGLEPGPTSVTGPASVPGGATVSNRTNADGTRTQTTTNTTHNVTYNGDTYNVTTTTTTIIQNFDENDNPIGPPITETNEETPPEGVPVEPPEDLECGLPGTPPCKIDETGTPSEVTADLAPVNDAKSELLGKVDELTTMEPPAWSFSFALPSSCSSISAGEFGGQSVSIDLCQHQPMIHDIVGLIWVITTVWVCIAMVGRTFSGS